MFERRPDLQGETERHEDKRRLRQLNFFFFTSELRRQWKRKTKNPCEKKKNFQKGEKNFFSRFRTLGLRTTHLQRVEDGENVEEDQRVRVDGQDAEDPGDSKDGKEDGDRLDGESGTRTGDRGTV